MLDVMALDHLVLTVADIDRTVAFYGGVLGMRPEQFRPIDGSVRWALAFGAQKINLHPADGPFDPKARVPQPGSADLCFLSDQPLDAWLAHFAALGVAVEQGPVRRTGATGPIVSLYVRDPDGNLIEVSNAVTD
jgi:catechol 2,3-dioxygenase-like lactoylglutathione lyase family enzyme